MTETTETTARWPTGWLILAGIVIGAGIGVWVRQIPLAMTAGLALGVGIDSLLHEYLNIRPNKPPDEPDPPDEDPAS